MRKLLALATLFVAGLTQAFPLTIDHKFGTTVIESAPERVATVDFNGADNLLALGVQPVVIRYWYGDYPEVVWPWAQEALTTEPEVLKGDLNFEQIASANPDVIIAIWSGITQEDYDKLSKIAPVVAVPEGTGDYAMSWDEQALTAGRVLGKEAEAQARVDAIRKQLAGIADAHPSWDGKTIAIANRWQDAVGAYTSNDIRPLLMSELGFVTPQVIDDAIDTNEFWVTFSMEDLSAIDTDLLMWVTSTDDFSNIMDVPARPYLDVVKENREVFLGTEVTGAFSFASLLSLSYAFDKMVPMIEAALDGDPDTIADARR
ncbi:ABC transporter substrate-binding protein [Reinekea blandensis]|uniref:Putative iron-siderophore binding lipoprotein n=1 Tax=Reinekea blandensis MED297 TaxID=314283 RepID=A4BJ32_9GAMM|nr:ABC transporter substrate-binding protein [Reinekea blandensis]EAR07877.1 putative iron-siderophore binding lipoprotein [Reinekea sp. MED297] [Reinekea blandensis MED297]